MSQQIPGQIVFTNKARCRDCNRCVRVCPVKAIRIEHGQASVVPDRCIACGTCIRECPQGAKQYRNDIAKADEIIKAGGFIAVSVAPSFAAVFNEWEHTRLPSALRQLGFNYVGETAVGAYFTAIKTAEVVNEQPTHSHICTACPAAVSYIEAYRPELVHALTPVVSPMIAHARLLKERYGAETKVIFIGPCVAKKSEAERPENIGVVDCVLTYKELRTWLESENISLQECEESAFEEEPEGTSRLFPIEGGSLRTADLAADLLATDTAAMSGYEAIREALDDLQNHPTPLLIEPLFCPQGCVGGPGMAGEHNLYDRRRQVMHYSAGHPGAPETEEISVDLYTGFAKRIVETEREVSEEEIREILARTGKTTPEDELNCSACGYNTCREKALAVARGLAEPEMCLPYMKRIAEQRSDRIIETSPNGIVILDERLNIIAMNPAFRRMFMCSEAVLGKRISYLMDPDPFERLSAGEVEVLETTSNHQRYNLITHQIMYKLADEKQYVGIFVNVTRSHADREELDKLRSRTIAQAQELLSHQITMAQEISRYLGESAARGEQLVDNLVRLAGDDNEGPDNEGNDWRLATYTSK